MFNFFVGSDGLPSKPLNMVISAPDSSHVRISWDVPADDGGSPILYYRLWRRMYGTTVIYGNTPTTATLFVDSGQPADVLHEYRFAAVNANGIGEYSDLVSVTTPGETIELDIIDVSVSMPEIRLVGGSDTLSLGVIDVPVSLPAIRLIGGSDTLSLGLINVSPTLPALRLTQDGVESSDPIVGTMSITPRFSASRQSFSSKYITTRSFVGLEKNG